MKGLTDIPGILVGHVSDYDGLTGCTAILCEGGAVGGVDVRGSASGTEEFELFNPLHLTERIHAMVLDRKSTRLNSSHANISYAVFCLKKKNNDDSRSFLG